jgi:hypothetical protein
MYRACRPSNRSDDADPHDAPTLLFRCEFAEPIGRGDPAIHEDVAAGETPAACAPTIATLTSYRAFPRTSAAALTFSWLMSASRTCLPKPTRRAIAWPI